MQLQSLSRKSLARVRFSSLQGGRQGHERLFHKAVRTDGEAAVGCDAARDTPVLRWSEDALTGGRSHSDTLVGCIVWSTTPSSSAIKVSRSTCWRSRALNAAIVLTAS